MLYKTKQINILKLFNTITQPKIFKFQKYLSNVLPTKVKVISSNLSNPSFWWCSIILLNTSVKCAYKSDLIGVPKSFICFN